ncbi:3-ketoacyl-CoA thiolase [Caballeronia glathei]|uniref:Propanoyl-CoA acyltransferase n=1 Tax=Caballeronia glathei TaxID=60547 RepID=A0A069PUP2_9BURK|nr:MULTISPECIES: thiolase family protein [Burkholderiaceae]KDR44255.1 propanoyl-CoA acyltransferase [Caballeronia glathei]TCK34590.1 acetyl-CoA acetyltransferase [Paraburkholderia sp. BL8N3]CDY77537.1 3-ketoacyl-CoA thiolase [Caballeronia glathei]
MKDIYISGVAMTRFGKHDQASMQDLAQEAVLGAVADASETLDNVEAFYCGNVFGGMILGQVLLRDLALAGVPVYNIENACASGASAVHLAMHALRAGVYETVVVFGVEQLTKLGGGTIPLQLNDYKTGLYAEQGMVLPAVYAMRGTRYLHEHGVTSEVLAKVAVKNRYNGSLNPYAQTRKETTVDEVLGSRMIADPLTLLQCCPSAVDGSAALVLTTRKPQGRHAPVRIIGSVVQSGIREQHDDDILDAEITARAARLAYRQAGIGPSEVDVVELHDAFTIAELIYYEALGLCAPGEGAALLESGETSLSGRIPVSPSGGLLAKGHPLGATGVAQMTEIVWQLQRRAGDRQITKHARIGLAQCTGGGIAGVDHAASSVHILSL